MPKIAEKFDQSRIDGLKRYLTKEVKNGRAKDFEISVDGFKIVPRTNNVAEFDDYEQEIDNDTQNLSILIYNGTTNRNTVYSFYYNEEPPAEEQKLGLDDIDRIVQQKFDVKEKEYEFNRLKEDLEASSAKLEEAEEYIGKIDTELIALRQELEDYKKGKMKGLLKSSEAVGNLIFQKVVGGILHKIPGGDGIAGFLGGDMDEQTPQTETEESTASFQKKGSAGEKPGSWDAYRKILDSAFTAEDRVAIITIIQNLSADPGRIKTVTKFLNIQTD